MTFPQLNASLKNFLRGWLLVWGLKKCLVECATLCVKSEVILSDVHVWCLFRNVISFNESKMSSSFKLICPFLLASAAVYVLLLHTLCCNSKGTPNVAFVSFKILMEPMLIQKQTKPHMKAHLIESKHFMGSRGHFCFYIFTLFF